MSSRDSTQRVCQAGAADRDQQIRGKARDLRPRHHRLRRYGRQVAAVAAAQIANGGRAFGRRHGTERFEQERKGIILVLDAAAFDAMFAAIDEETETVIARDNVLKREPPQLAKPIGKVGRHIDGHRRVVPFQDWPGVLEKVAIAVVEGEANQIAAAGQGAAGAHGEVRPSG